MTKPQTIQPFPPKSLEDLTHSLAWVPGNIMVADGDGIVRYVNTATLTALEYGPDDIIGQEMTLFWDQPEKTSLKIMSQLKKEGAWQGEIRQKGGSGWELVSLSIVPGGKADSPYIIKIGHPVDKTTRSLLESSSGQSEKDLQALMDATPYVISIFRFSDRKYMAVNRNFCLRTGYTKEEILGRTVLELGLYKNLADREKFNRVFERDGFVNELEIQFVSKDNETIDGVISARRINFRGDDCGITSSMDVSELRRTQRALKESEKNYRAILEVTPNSVSILRHSDSKYVFVNEAFARNTGYSVNDTIGKRVQDLNLFETSAERDRFLNVFRTKGRVDGMELRFRKKDGSFSTGLVSASPVVYGEKPCILVIVTNIDTLKKVQKDLSEREANYRTILEMAPYTIVITKRSDSTYMEANPACLRRIGYTREEVIGKSPMELGLYENPKNREAILEAIRKDGHVMGLEVCFKAKDGGILESLLSAAPITYKGEDCLLFVSVDITKQKQVQRRLQDREETYRGILAAAPYSIMITRRSDSTYMEVNDAYCNRTGYSREEVIGKTALELKMYEQDSDRKKMIEVLGRDGWVDGMEIKFRTKEGKLIENLFSTTPITYQGEACLLSMTVDISRQKAAERALRRSEQKYRNVLINMEEGYWECDLKGNFTFLNEAECRIHRSTPEKLLGKNNRDYTSPETARNIFKIFQTVYQTGVPAMITEYEMTREDGTKAYIDSSASLLKDETGTPIGFYGIARDITEKKKADDELEKYRKRLEDMVRQRTEALENAQHELVKREKLSTLGQLTATVSHELRNPLGVIRSSSFYLRRKSDTRNEKINKHFKRIEEQINLCDLIIADLLEYTRGRSVTLEKQPLSPWLEKLISQLEEVEDVPIEKHFSKSMPAILYDREKMRRVFVNLIENAGHAVRARSEIQQKAKKTYAPKISVFTRQEKDKVTIEIQDNGVGMDKTTCKRAFEALFTTRARGTGIGLANVKKIISEHNGQVTLFSEPGKGTNVIITLPLSKE